jgi:hypothetical protein
MFETMMKNSHQPVQTTVDNREIQEWYHSEYFRKSRDYKFVSDTNFTWNGSVNFVNILLGMDISREFL